MRSGDLKEAPNFTIAALVMAGINLLWLLIAFWVSFGFLAALAVCYALERGFAARRRAA